MDHHAHVLVAGNIGAGKSTLVAALARMRGWTPVYEPAEANPYLDDFYREMSRWAFHSQVFFLVHRARLHQQAAQLPGIVVQDRSLYEDAEIFAYTLYRQGHLSERDYHTYRALYEMFRDLLPPPDLVVYLQASVETLQRRIARRGRAYEHRISRAYLAALNQRYEAWMQKFTAAPVLVLPADHMDFVAQPEWIPHIAAAVERLLQAAPRPQRYRFTVQGPWQPGAPVLLPVDGGKASTLGREPSVVEGQQ